MLHFSEDRTADHLRNSGRIQFGEPVEVRELAGGVSNVVLLVSLPSRGERFVIKQARGRLRVKEEWLCPVERIWREVEVLRVCVELLEVRNAERGLWSPIEVCVPQVLWEDRENYLYAMSAAPEGHRTWKEMLLAGEIQASVDIASSCGSLLAALHGGSWQNPSLVARLGDRTYFDQLRLDPYYRQVARVHPDLSVSIERLLESVAEHRCCLVHGDYSPKNILVWPGHLMLIDFEVGHYGDPAFDLGFFLTHLVLKSIWSGPRRPEYLRVATTFWESYRAGLAAVVPAGELGTLESRLVLNLAGCMLARVDGKSPVDYLMAPQQEQVRRIARGWLVAPPTTLAAAITALNT